MLILTRISSVQTFLKRKSQDQTIGFCPTMGALHRGHISLISASKKTCDITVCSIFVNPTQFNDPEDLVKYPRNWSKDLSMLMDAGCDIVFIPGVDEIYPADMDTKVHLNLDHMTKIMEGLFRPGHFDGMMQVVNRLLNIVQADALFMGQKDFQQQAIVKEMIARLGLKTQLVVCPIIREPDGLAMSSRNQRLSESERQSALTISSMLSFIKANFDHHSLSDLKRTAESEMMKAGLKPEYIEFCDGETLGLLKSTDNVSFVVCCIAAWAGNVRLIDNMILRRP